MVFVTDTLRAYSVEEAVRLVKKGKLENVYPATRGTSTYLRTKPSVPKEEKLERLSISSYRLFASADDIRYALSTPAFSDYWQLYRQSLEGDEEFIVVGGHPRITKKAARVRLQMHRELVFEAAKRFNVDPYLLGAIIIDEIARLAAFEEITNLLAVYFVGRNTSGGIAQVKTDTARGLIKQGYYNPDPGDPKLSKEKINRAPRSYLYSYVKQPKHSIHFAAARMRALIDEWKKFIDLPQWPEIITTLYHLPHKAPHANPRPNDRGLQIVKEFYPLAKRWLQ
jgi:hypothetical protein